MKWVLKTPRGGNGMKWVLKTPRGANGMKWVLRIVSVSALGLTVIPAFLVFGRTLTWETHTMLMLAGTVLWFATAPFCVCERRNR